MKFEISNLCACRKSDVLANSMLYEQRLLHLEPTRTVLLSGRGMRHERVVLVT